MRRPDLNAIQKRADAASAGPWVRWQGHLEVMARPKENTRGCFRGGEEIADFETPNGTQTQSLRNIRFVAAARKDVPELVAYCRQLEALVVRADEALGFDPELRSAADAIRKDEA